MTLITDFSIAQPTDRLITDDSTTFGPISRPKPGAWRLIEYETELFSGRFLQASDRQAAVLTVPLDCDGWHAVSIGIAASGVKQGPASIEVRLEGDEHWQYLRAEGWFDNVEEPWIIADLTGRSLQVRFPQQVQGPVLARLCSVRAVPVRDEHVRELQADPPRPLVFSNDGNMFNGAEPGTEVVEQAFRTFAGSPWTMGCYGVGGADIVHYDTKVGNIIGQDAWDSEEGYLGSYDVVTAMIDMGLDPLQVAIDSAHRMGQGIIAYLRVQCWICEPPAGPAVPLQLLRRTPRVLLRGGRRGRRPQQAEHRVPRGARATQRHHARVPGARRRRRVPVLRPRLSAGALRAAGPGPLPGALWRRRA